MRYLTALALFTTIVPIIYGQEKGTQSKPNTQRSGQPKQETQQAPSTVNVINQQAADKEESGPKSHTDSYLHRLLAPENLPNLGLLLAGIWGICIAIRTLKAIERQATAMMDADCALCCIVWENFIHINPEVPNGILAHCFTWTFTNAGKSPAFVEKVACRFIVIKSLDELPPEPNYPKPKELAAESEPVLAGQTYERGIYAPLETTLSYQEMEAEHRSKKCLLYAYGFVRYLDVYGREQETRFGLVYDSAPTPTRAVDRFRMAGPRAYNRYKRPQGKQKPN